MAAGLTVVLLQGPAVPASARVVPAPDGGASAKLDWSTAAKRGPAPTSPPFRPVEPAPLARSEPAPGAKATALPRPVAKDVTLTGKPVQVGPITVSASTRSALEPTVRVEVLPERPGLSGFAFRMSAKGGNAGDAKVSIDYSDFAERFGAGYADRLKLVALDGGDTVPATNDRKAKRLTARVAVGAPATFAVMAGAEGEEGSFKATPLALSGDWQVGAGSGEFTYRYDFPLAESPAGPTPQVGLGYSSGAVDGMVSGRNTQSGPVGLGWSDFANSFIERRYNSCLDDGQATADLCWRSENATIALQGRTSELVPVPNSNPKQWRLRSDPRWRVEWRTGADNGDNDGEHWVVTTPDGVRYFFGLGENPDVGVETNSVWTVPVFGDDAGEPCATATPVAWCTQAWRWNLDLVIDPNDNVQQYEYTKEINHYSALNGWPGFEHVEYVRSGVLRVIKYGKRRVETEPSAEVHFDTDYRCRALEGCAAPTPATAANYPDTPVDLMCFTAVCGQHTPTFFTALRYTEATAHVDDGGTMVEVDWFRLSHSFPDPDLNRSGDEKLYLLSVQRIGRYGEDIALPAVIFFPVLLANRVDTAGGALSAMPHYRVGAVVNEFGGQVAVTYGRPHPCPDPIPSTPNWDLNTRNCFPHWHAPEGAAAGFAVFHKYVVTRVEARDPIGGSPTVATNYLYGDQVQAGLPNGAWHHDRDEFSPNSVQSWSEWRGYQDVKLTQGTSTRRLRVFRGMHRDRLAGDAFPGPGSRVATVSSMDGTVTNVADENWLAGRALEELNLRSDGTVESAVIHGHHTARTVDALGPDPLDDAWFVVPNDTVERLRQADGGYARRRIQVVVNGLLGTPDRIIEHGWTAVAGDERCTRMEPVVNADAWLLDHPSSTTRYANGTCTGAEVARSEYAYDGGTVGQAPTKGNRTTERTKVDATTWSVTQTTVDALGRPTRVTDANGHHVTTAYSPPVRYPAVITVTNHLGHVARTDWNRPMQAAATETDARGRRTTYVYDSLGRTVDVRRPTEQGSGAPATFHFGYDIDPDRQRLPVVRTSALQDSVGGSPRYVDSWAVYDSQLRERQTQRLSPEAGKVIVRATTYDDRGLVAFASAPQAVTGVAGAGLLAAPAGGWANDVQTAYDELRRPVWEINRVGGAYRSSTAIEYAHDSMKKTPHPPAGGVTRTVFDAYARPVRVEELDGSTWRATTYGYDSADHLVSVRDPANNTITDTYDMAGRRVATSDPDTGNWTFGYDLAGNQTRTTSPTGLQLHTIYDPLNRVVEKRRDSVTGTLLASWAYDRAGETGLLDRSTRFDPTGTWVLDVAGYDDRERPTGHTWVVPTGATGLSGSYTLSYGYDAADHRTRITYPAVGGLPAETVTTSFNTVGLPETLTGDAEYVWGAAYDDRTRPVWILSGSRTVPFSRTFEYNSDQRLARQAAGGGSTLLQDIRFTYNDTTGDVVQRDTTLNGQSWRECYGHDDLRRLVRAYTTTGTCATGAPGTGAAPYDHRYQYGVDGNLTARVEGGTTTNYTYPAAGTAHPHAPTAVGSSLYTWNASGELATRTVNAQAETFSWTAERQLASVTGPGGGSSFVYDADGQRVLRQSAGGRTLYIEGHEITATGSGVTATRSYTFGDSLVATRGATGVEYLATENQGSVQLAVPTGATTPSRVRTYLPYGKERSATGTARTDRGFVGQFEDTSTRLAYLNARYYDPAIGRFISADPVFRPETPQTLNPYAYGLNNPVSLSDPSGLDACDTPDCGDSFTPTKKKKKKPTKGAAKAKVAKKVKKGISISQKAESPSLSEATADAIDKAIDDVMNNEFSGRGVCLGGTAGPKKESALYANGCLVVLEDEWGVLLDVGDMIGSTGPSGEATTLITNAHTLDDLRGYGTCANATVNHLSGTMCVSLMQSGDGLVPSGIFVWMPGVSTSKSGGGVSFGYTRAHSFGRPPPLASRILDYGLERFVMQCHGDLVGCAEGIIGDTVDQFIDQVLPTEISFPELPDIGFESPFEWP
ncbi:RHS repeat-associated core domain-containing protein [Phytohabitans sp. LJ34]|uniref:RHS repeat domain-containing protein n=1 Tax=Phytohabitans sp. LJ34 TaxID=3452217 RepID=UPI003F897C69